MVYKGLCIAESVRKGHPDKICDQISDAILDLCLGEDSDCHTAIECLGTKGHIIVAGEILSKKGILPIDNTVRDVYRDCGYGDEIEITNLLSYQSKQLNIGTENGGANDQGIVYGYAERSPYNYLPIAPFIANMLAKVIDDSSRNVEGLLSDGKVLVMSDDGGVQQVIVNVQHDTFFNEDSLREKIKNLLFALSVESTVKVHINNHDNFHDGGFRIDTGLTGRKIMVDTYGGIAFHGGGAFSGKDPSKIDRTGAYMARFVAKNLVANGYADKCTVALAYEFGKQQPSRVEVCTEKGIDEVLANYAKETFDFRPLAIVERFDLRHFSFSPTAIYGHFTNPDYPWERINNL